MNEFLQKINPVDVFIGIVFIYSLYGGIKRGIIVEIFKIAGVVFATFVALHYFIPFADFWEELIALPVGVSRLLCFSLLALGVIFLFKLLRDGWLLLFNIETRPALDKWGGAFLSLLKAGLLSGLIFIVLFLSGNKTVIEKTRSSFSGFYLADVSPRVYGAIFHGFVSKIFPAEKERKEVFMIKEIKVKGKSR